MKKVNLLLYLGIFLLQASISFSAQIPISEASSECIDCHASVHPGIVKDWQNSRHAEITPKEAMAVDGPARKVSSEKVPDSLKGTAVGCAECHMLRPGAHADTFEHNGYEIHVVVSPGDCATCHSEEAQQYSKNLMANAYDNLAETGGTEFAAGDGRGTELSAYLQTQWKSSLNWILELGARLDRWAPSSGEISLDTGGG